MPHSTLSELSADKIFCSALLHQTAGALMTLAKTRLLTLRNNPLHPYPDRRRRTCICSNKYGSHSRTLQFLEHYRDQ